MNISRFFIDRPIFAAVVAVFITLMGVFAYPLLPLSQYPEIAPPTITINTAYPGASAETVAETVAAPIEQEVNGVEGMLYVSSSSTSDGAVSVTVTFQPGTDLDAAQVLVQNRVALAEPRLPEQVRQIGVTVNKQESGFLMILGMTSPDKSLDNDYVGNYANSTLRDRLLRLDGVGAVQIFGGGNYAMRVWIDPGKAAARGLTGPDIVAALRAQNVQAAAGAIGQPPFATNAAAFQLPVQVQGRLSDPDQFSNIVIKTDAEGRVTRVRDIARVELGAQDYGIRGFFDGERGVGVAVIQQPGANALGTADRVLAEIEAIKADLPQGMDVSVAYNPTEFVAASVESVQHTLIEAVILVVLVVIVFLQTWRAAIIPIVAIPVALVATFAVQLALGYSINSLSLFALVLAVGIVVDDAIVVVENVERYIREGLTPKEAAYRSMQEVSGALISIGLVLVSVFVPTMFVPGIPGIFYREFAIVITTASVVSLIVSLTLSPAMAALLLKPHREHETHRKPGLWGSAIYYGGYAGRKFNEGFDWLSDKYGRLTARLVRTIGIVLIVYVALLGLTTWRLLDTPSGFIPEQDQGFLIGVIQLPPGASLERTEAVMTRASEIIKGTDGVEGMVAFAGLDGSSFSFGSNAATIFIRLDAFEERKSAEQAAAALAGAITGATMGIEDANIFVIAPPAVQGLGNGNGFQMMVQDRSGAGYRALEGATFAMMGGAAQNPDLQQVFSTYNTGSPRIAADVDRDKALMMGVQPSDVFNTLGVYLGSSYVNDFNFLGRTFRVTAQAEPSARDDIADIANLQTRSASGAMVPIGSVATLREDSGPARIVRYNLFPAAELQGQAAAGVSSGQAIASMERLAEATLPPGFSYEWTGLALQEKQSSGGATVVFIMAVVLVFLVLAAQYEAFTLPLSVVLIVPMCILAAMIGINIRGLDNNILVQVGLVVLIALAAKNAILIVEFAKQAEDEGLNRWDAAVRAAKTRLRPILMTSFAFIFGVVPLMLATGAGAEMRQSLGTAVFSGMLGVTFFGLIFTPVFYVLMRGIAARIPGSPKKEPGIPTTGGPPPHDRIETAPVPASPRLGDA
ncbi:MAG: hypothetical protein RL093_907 [Pseudomonadota bacterium]